MINGFSNVLVFCEQEAMVVCCMCVSCWLVTNCSTEEAAYLPNWSMGVAFILFVMLG